MRLFAAVGLDDEVRDAVAGVARRLAARAGGSLRLVQPAQLHVTLAFMGAVDPSRATRIAAAIEEGFAQRPFRVAFGGLGVLPPRGHPRVLFVEVASGRDALIALQREVAARLEAEGIALEKRPFRPHLTIARWRDGRGDPGRSIVATETIPAVYQIVTSVTLYESRLSPKGATHTPLAAGRLGRSE